MAGRESGLRLRRVGFPNIWRYIFRLESSVFLPYLPTLQRLALALAVGLFAGLEREHRGKEAGLRTFAFVALIGCVGALLGESFALLSVGLTGVLIVFLNVQTIGAGEGAGTVAFVLMLGSDVALVAARYQSMGRSDSLSEAPALNQPGLQLSSPFSITSALKYGLVFLVLQIAGALGQRTLGQAGFYVVSILGGVVSSASAVASAALLAAHGTVTPRVASIGAVVATVVSALINVPFAARISNDTGLAKQLAWTMGALAALGVVGAAVQDIVVTMAMRL